MAKLELISEENNDPANYYYGEYSQGTYWTNYKVFRITTDSGEEVFFKVGQSFNSYGDASGMSGPELVEPKEATVVSWQ
jgi:hypothetical protein